MTMRPKQPTTTEGMPERSSMAGLIHSLSFGLASCETKMAAASASGTAKSSATMVALMLPMMSGMMLYFLMLEMGCQMYSGLL